MRRRRGRDLADRVGRRHSRTEIRAKEMNHDTNHIRKYLFKRLDGQWEEIKQYKILSACPYINERIGYFMPIDTVDVEEVKKLVRYVGVRVNRACSPEEVNKLVEQIKGFLLESLEHMEHHERYMYERGTEHESESNERRSGIRSSDNANVDVTGRTRSNRHINSDAEGSVEAEEDRE